MKQKIVGNYFMGLEQVQLVLREGDGGEFWLAPEIGHIARIKVGIGTRGWPMVVSVLIHEALEMQFTRSHCRYSPDPDIAKNHDGFLFMCGHPMFAEVVARVGEFVAEALPDLGKEYRKWKP